MPSGRQRALRLVALPCLAALAANVVAATPRPPGVIPLFNGTNLTGWTTWLVDSQRQDPRRVFSVSNGMIRILGDGLGYLATTEEFADYQLRVEFKWGLTNSHWGDRLGRARDSGIFLHATGPDGNSHDGRGAFRAAIECQIMEGATGDFLLIRGTNSQGTLIAPRLTVWAEPERDADGWPFVRLKQSRETSLERWGRVNWAGKSRAWRDDFGYRGGEDAERPVGEWNRLVITCAADSLEVELNDARVNQASRVWPARGRILLQCEGSEIFFRKVDLVRMAQ